MTRKDDFVRKRGSKRKMRYGRIIFCLACVAFLAIGIRFALAKPDAFTDYKNVNEENKTVGTLVHKIEDDHEEQVVFVHYPQFNNETIDRTIQTYVDNISPTSGITFLDYESSEIFERYITIHFIYQKLSLDKHVEEETHTYMNFDKQSAKLLTTSDVFRRDYKDAINSEMQKASTTLSDIDTASFRISDAGIHIYSDDQKEITIGYESHQKYIRLVEKSIAQNHVETKRVRNIDPNKPMVALTFDDGPSIYTEDFITTLVENDASATFFMLGKNIDQHPDIVKRMVEENIEIANHSWDHQNTASNDAAFIKQEIYDTQDALFRLTGKDATQFRPPYGAHNALTDEIAKQGGIGIALWTVDTEDWNNRDASITLERARVGNYDGAIILFHDLYPTSLEAIKTLIPELKAAGYQLVTFSEIIEHRY